MKKYSSTISERLTGRHKFSFALCGDIKGLSVLDVGSSFGWFERFALAAGVKKVVGIEPEEESFYKARKEVSKAVFKRGTALKIPEKDSSYDLVVMFDVIEHIPVGTEDQALKEIYRVLKKGGSFIMSTDYDLWISKIMDPAWYFGHRHYSQQRLEKLFRKAGFQIEQVEHRGGFFEIIGTILLYIFKWIFRSEVPFKSFINRQKDSEYLDKNDGLVTIFVRSSKQ